MYKRNAVVFGTICVGLLLLSFLAATVSGCTKAVASQPDEPAIDPMRAGWPAKLVLAVIPYEDADKVTKRFEPFTAYLEKRLGVPVQFFIGTDYSAIIEAMRNKHVDIGGFGPFSYVIAASRANAEAFATSLRSPTAKPVYWSYIIGREDRGIEKLADLKGKSFAFVDPASTSGHLFPRAELVQALELKKEEVDTYFSSVRFSGGHDASFLAVLNGDVDGAAIASSQWDRGHKAFADHPHIKSLRIVHESKPIPSSPSAVRKDLPETLKDAIRLAYYEALGEPSLKAFFEEHNTLGGYVPTADDAYDVIRDAAKALDLGPEDLMGL